MNEPLGDFIIKRGRGTKASYGIANIKAAHYPEINVPDGKAWSVGGFKMQPVKGTGRYHHDRVILLFDRAVSATQVMLDRLHIGSLIRYIRLEERAEIERIDAEIEALRQQRRKVVRMAWDKGHTVTAKFLAELADLNERERQERERARRAIESELRRD